MQQYVGEGLIFFTQTLEISHWSKYCWFGQWDLVTGKYENLTFYQEKPQLTEHVILTNNQYTNEMKATFIALNQLIMHQPSIQWITLSHRIMVSIVLKLQLLTWLGFLSGLNNLVEYDYTNKLVRKSMYGHGFHCCAA